MPTRHNHDKPDAQATSAPLPPHSEDSERALLAAILIDSETVWRLLSDAGIAIPVAAFYIPAHLDVYATVSAMRARSTPIDLATVAQAMRDAGTLNRVGGDAFLAALADSHHTTAHAVHHAREILSRMRRREIIEAATTIAAAAHDGSEIDTPLRSLQAAIAPITNAVTLADAAAYIRDAPPPHDPIFVGLIDRGDKGGIIAKAKTRKTFFALQMAVCAAAGVDFLRWQPVKQLSVLYCNYEVRAHHLWRRIHHLGRALGVAPCDLSSRLQIANLRASCASVDDVAALVTRTKSDMVILDPLYKVVSEGDENKAEDLKPYLALFDRLCETTGACLWYVHHDTKGQAGDRDARDRGSGSSVLNRDFDACITLTDHVDGDEMLVVHALPRNYAPVPDVTVRWDNGAFTVTDILPEAVTSQKQQSPYKDKVREYAAANPDASIRDVARAVGCSKSVAAKWWTKEEEGLL